MSLDHTDRAARLERELRFHTALRELLVVFAQGVSTTLSLPHALDAVTRDVATLLGASRVDVWLHDRRARELTLAASSDSTTDLGERVPTDDESHPAARGLRLEQATDDGACILAPLRGWRRALGAVVIEAPSAANADRPQLVGFSHEIGRQLSVGIENVQLLDEVMRQRRLLEDTFNSLVDLVVVIDNQMRIVQTNDAFASRIGTPRAELLEQPLSAFVGAETAAWVAAADPAQAPLPSGTRPVEDARLGGTFLLTATPLITQQGDAAGRVLVARDITRQTRLEAERAALRERLAQSEKLASLGQFVAGIAHEMNNPLQGVLGHLELLIDMSEAAKPMRKELRQIYQDADRAAKIVGNLLVFTGSRRMARRRLQLDRVVSRAVASRAASLRRNGIEVVRRQGADVPAVVGDPLLLQQALLNILINAEHAIVDHGAAVRRITIATSSDAAGDRVTLTVHDSGPGIPADVLPRMFDPFFTTKDVGKGTGLGLAIAYGIVQEHGGTIAGSNDATGGAVFRIDLPPAEVVVK
jgi:two-component system NtrC family sensor kinase